MQRGTTFTPSLRDGAWVQDWRTPYLGTGSDWMERELIRVNLGCCIQAA
jgi:hypothetical protein